MENSELLRSMVRPFITIFLIVIWGVLVAAITLGGGDAMEAVPKELTVAALSYVTAYSYIRTKEKEKREKAGGS